MSNKKESFFWTSYSDLMTSLFFVMLVLFVLTIVLTHNALVQSEELRIATEQELRKIRDLQNAVKKIDDTYFEYDSSFKRHTIKDISISFKPKSADINDISAEDRQKLFRAGLSIQSFLKEVKESIPEAEYLIIIEGQSSRDSYARNNELSYERALALKNFWKANGLSFNELPCELLVSGSGYESKFRIKPEFITLYEKGRKVTKGNEKNQRFVIHIIPKPGDFNN